MPSNKQRYENAFVEALGLAPDTVNQALVYNSVPSWDSVGHMTLMAALETEFDLMLETDDIIAFNSYGRGMEILARYGVEITEGVTAEATA